MLFLEPKDASCIGMAARINAATPIILRLYNWSAQPFCFNAFDGPAQFDLLVKQLLHVTANF